MRAMKYDEKYPNPGVDALRDSDGCMVRCLQGGPCYVCGEPTHWADVAFEAAICSEECASALEGRFLSAITECERRAMEAVLATVE